jgi:preprotein translocase subunit YajC
MTAFIKNPTFNSFTCTNSFSLHYHAINRLQERFNLDHQYLLNELENGRFVFLNGYNKYGKLTDIRSGYLIYFPNKDEYGVVIIENRSRLGVTVLTEEMALNSSLGKELNENVKLKAKTIAFGEKSLDNSQLLHFYAKERGQLICTNIFK